MNQRTALYDTHVAAGARMVPFAGWDMPLHYGSQIEEHHAVRRGAGMFDVSHMTILDVTGPDTLPFLQTLLANDVGRLDVAGAAQYGVMLNEAAGVVDDLISYRRTAGYRLVTNAGTHGRVLGWLEAQRQNFQVDIVERDLAMLAVQGPDALDRVGVALGRTDLAALETFGFLEAGDILIARTGYTGEDGVELMLPGAAARTLWQSLTAAGVAPAGLGARDTLRCEAGLNLYGQDMDETVNPLEANLAWTVAWQPEERQFLGRAALQAIREAGPEYKLTGLVLEGRGVLRAGQPVQTEAGEGVVTSGIFSPTLGYSIALARLPRRARGQAAVEIRNKMLTVAIVKPPFVRNGRQVYADRSTT